MTGKELKPIDYSRWTPHEGSSDTFFSRSRRDSADISTSVIVSGSLEEPIKVKGIVSARDGRRISVEVLTDTKCIRVTHIYYPDEECARMRKTVTLLYDMTVGERNFVETVEVRQEGVFFPIDSVFFEEMGIPNMRGKDIDLEALVQKLMDLDFGLPRGSRDLQSLLLKSG